MAHAVSPTSIKFKVQRGEPELITPSKPTPYEFKPLSDLDNLDWFRNQARGLRFYPRNPSMDGIDPVKLIRRAIAETLVFYYPLAGRLREGPTSKLIVECTGEGILFVEADADVTLEQFGFPLVPPFPCLDQLIYEEPSSSEILNCPLMLIQVTRLKCGGFIFGIRANHTMFDAAGEVQFVSAIGEMARGATCLSVLPVWERHVLSSKNPLLSCKNPQLTYSLPESNNDISSSTNDVKLPLEHDLCYKAFIFGPIEISTLRRCLPLNLRHCSSFEILTAVVWKCRVAALQPYPTEEMSLVWAVNLHGNPNHFIPFGYYGNSVGLSAATSTAKEILENPLCYTLQLLRNASEKVDIEDYDRSITNLMAKMTTYTVSDLRHAGSENADFGWGKAVFGGPSICVPIVGWYQLPSKRKKGLILPLCLPNQAMEIFEMELNNMLKDSSSNGDDNAIISKL